MKPTLDRILVKEIKKEKTAGGIIITDTAQAAKSLSRWEVLEIGQDCKVVKKGDVILTQAFAGVDIVEIDDVKKDNEVVRVMRESDAILIV